MFKKIYNNSGIILFIVILLIIFLLIPFTFKNEYILNVTKNNIFTVKDLLKDNDYYMKNKAMIKITKITLSYNFFGSSHSLSMFDRNKEVPISFESSSSLSNLEQYVKNNGYSTDKIATILWIFSLMICVILSIISIIRCIKKLYSIIKNSKKRIS